MALDAGQRFGRSGSRVSLVAGVALVVAPKYSAYEFLLVTPLAPRHRLQGLAVGRVTLAAALYSTEARFAVILLMVIMAIQAVPHCQSGLAVRNVTVAAIDLGVGRYGKCIALGLLVALLTSDGAFGLASGEDVACFAIDRIGM
tara:strand:+ start:34659 stop:35090 length:432 start_codon:yes stop_codon:yes gene_type:complete